MLSRVPRPIPFLKGAARRGRAGIDVGRGWINPAGLNGYVVAEPGADDGDRRARRECGLQLVDRVGTICLRKHAGKGRQVIVGVDADERQAWVGCISCSLPRCRAVGELARRGQKVDAIDEAHASLPLLIRGHMPLAYCHIRNMASSKAASLTDDQRRPIDAIICIITGQFAHISRSFTGCVVETMTLVKSALPDNGDAVINGLGGLTPVESRECLRLFGHHLADIDRSVLRHAGPADNDQREARFPSTHGVAKYVSVIALNVRHWLVAWPSSAPFRHTWPFLCAPKHVQILD